MANGMLLLIGLKAVVSGMWPWLMKVFRLQVVGLLISCMCDLWQTSLIPTRLPLSTLAVDWMK